MKTYMRFLALALPFGWQSLCWGQNEFPIGVLTYGFQNGNDSLYAQIKEMNCTWMEAWGQLGGLDVTTINFKAVQNVAGIKLLLSRTWNIGALARSQRLRFEAEYQSDNGAFDPYFKTHAVGAPTEDSLAWKATAPGTAGFMVKDPEPAKEYHYGRNIYVATFIMKIDSTVKPDTTIVVTLEVVDKTGTIRFGADTLRKIDFYPYAGYKAFAVPFNLLSSPAPKIGALAGAPATLYTDSVNIRVKWHGAITAYLDYVTIEDSVATPIPATAARRGAAQIFPRFGQTTGPNDATIYNDAAQFASASPDKYPLVQRFYLNDEPQRNGYLSYRYIDELIKNNAGMDNISQGRGRGIGAKAYDYLQRFVQDANPHELFVFGYWIDADVPSPAMTEAQATDAGVKTMSEANYNDVLQTKTEWATINILQEAITKANSASRPFWFIAQAHGDLCQNTGEYRGTDDRPFIRPPTGNELRMMVHLALAYGAKGIFYYTYGTQSLGEAFGCSETWSVGLTEDGLDGNNKPRHNSNEGSFIGVSGTRYTGYQEKWNAVQQINADLKILGPILLNLTWQTAFTSGETAPDGSIVTAISGGAYIEAATYSPDYIMLVNRKCLSEEVQTIEITTNKTGEWLMDDQLTHERFVSSNGTFKNIVLNPGQGRLFKLHALTSDEN